MEIKDQILKRTYLVFVGLFILALAIVCKITYIQIAQGKYWRSMSDSTHIRYETIPAERGTIYSEAGEVLSTSIPEFDIYFDFQADGLVEKDGLLFNTHADSLAIGLAKLFNDKSAKEYRKILQTGFRQKDRFFLLKRKISFSAFEDLKKLPLVRLGRNKSGLIGIVRMKRLYPYRNLANRTIGIARENNKVGLEKSYDSTLGGVDGGRLVRYIAGGAGVPVEGTDQEPIDGHDIVTTLDVNIQEIAHQALAKMMVGNDCERGTCIVMEVKTGKIRAIANLGKQKDGNYWEDYNYALALSEPGSTWKLVTLMSVLEDRKVNLETQVDLENGRWNILGLTVFDSEVHGLRNATVKTAFERSSNVGMAKLAYYHYNSHPTSFLNHIKNWHMNVPTGLDISGELKPRIYKPGTSHWSKTTLPWMGFGYNLAITPLHTAMLYNAIANGGVMMKPYLVHGIMRDGLLTKTVQPKILNKQVCRPEVLNMVKSCLEGVVLNGTARSLKTNVYTIAGKTGTSLVADKGITYKDHMYQSSFAGYFPANDPQYTIVVVIRNKPHAAKYYGGLVAGPVFREVADKLYGSHLFKTIDKQMLKGDSSQYLFAAQKKTIQQVASQLQWKIVDSSSGQQLVTLKHEPLRNARLVGADSSRRVMTTLAGVALKDALEWCEQNGLEVSIKGKGRVASQSILPGNDIRRGQKIILELN